MIHTKPHQKGYMKRYVAFQMRHKGTILFLGLVFLTGVIIGCRLASGEMGTVGNVLTNLLGGASITGNKPDFLESVFSVFTANGILLILLFVCGFCAISQPMVLGILLFKGLGFGLMGGFLYASGEKSSLLYYALVLLPEMLFSITVLIVAAKEALGLSKTFFVFLLPNRGKEGEESGNSIQVYCARFVALLLLSGALSVLVGLIQTAYRALLG